MEVVLSSSGFAAACRSGRGDAGSRAIAVEARLQQADVLPARAAEDAA